MVSCILDEKSSTRTGLNGTPANNLYIICMISMSNFHGISKNEPRVGFGGLHFPMPLPFCQNKKPCSIFLSPKCLFHGSSTGIFAGSTVVVVVVSSFLLVLFDCASGMLFCFVFWQIHKIGFFLIIFCSRLSSTSISRP